MNTYLHILSSHSFTLGELRSKGTLYSCFIRILLRWRTWSIVEMLILLIPWKCVLSCITLSWISLSRIILSWRSMHTITASWSRVNIAVLPPACGSLAILQKSRCAVTTNIHTVLWWTLQRSIERAACSTVNLQVQKYSSILYLFSSLNVLTMVDTENWLKLCCTLSPASLIVSPWTRTWSMTIARIVFLFILLFLFLALFLLFTLLAYALVLSHCFFYPFSDFLLPTCLLSELAYIGCVTSFETGCINFEWLYSINYMCSLFVFDCCHLCLPVWMTCIRVQNVFWEWECV